MSALAEMRVGWCPGALRPMMSGDGLIVRVKPRGMALTVECVVGIAAAAARHGNGSLDLTTRANLQIRGVSDASLPALAIELDAMGLLDADAGAEARRNVVASPLMGLDPSAGFDVRAAVAALEARLVSETSLAALPSKFGFAVSDGGATALDDVSADVRFDAMTDGRFAVRLGGDGGAVACCTPGELPDVAVRLARTFIDVRRGEPDLHRMREVVASIGACAVMARADLQPTGPGASSTALRAVPLLHVMEEDRRPARCGSSSAERKRGSGRSPVEEADGARPSTISRTDPIGRIDLAPASVLGVAARFGRLDAAQLDTLARGAARAGAAELRLTPWRAILVPGLSGASADRLAQRCAAAGWIVDPADPRLRVAACAGAPGCRRATTPVLDDAARWAGLLGPGGTGMALHVSGCAKGCAHPGPAPLTLVAAEGRYALVADGTAADTPIASGLDAGEARRLLKTILRLDRRP